MTCVTQDILSQLLVLKYCHVLMPLFARIEASHPDNWCSVLQTAKEVSITSFEKLDFLRCVQDGLLKASVKHKTERQAISSELFVHFGVKGETFLSQTLQQIKPESIILNLTQKRQSMKWHHPQSPKKKKFENFHQRVMSWSLSSGTVKEWCRERRETTPMPTPGQWQNTQSFSSQFGLTRVQQKSCFSLKMQGYTQVWRVMKPSQNFVGPCYTIHPTDPI